MKYDVETLKQYEEVCSNLESELREIVRKKNNIADYSSQYNNKLRLIRNCQYKLNHIRQILFNK